MGYRWESSICLHTKSLFVKPLSGSAFSRLPGWPIVLRTSESIGRNTMFAFICYVSIHLEISARVARIGKGFPLEQIDSTLGEGRQSRLVEHINAGAETRQSDRAGGLGNGRSSFTQPAAHRFRACPAPLNCVVPLPRGGRESNARIEVTTA
jgi:hypothetical protein